MTTRGECRGSAQFSTSAVDAGKRLASSFGHFALQRKKNSRYRRLSGLQIRPEDLETRKIYFRRC